MIRNRVTQVGIQNMTHAMIQGLLHYMSQKWVWLIFAMALIKAGLITQFPLFGDEAYYWQWSKHLDLSYYEQGPVLGLVVWIFTFFGSFSHLFAIRLASLVLSVLISFVSVNIYKKLFRLSDTNSELFGLACFIQFSAIFFISSILMVHDSVMIFFYSIFLWFLLLYLENQNSKILPIAMGISIGLGTMSKLTLGVIYPLVILYLLLFWKPSSYRTRNGGIIRFTVSYLITLSPMLYWNLTHNFATIQYLIDRKGNSTGFTIRHLFDFVGSQVLIISPWFFPFFIQAAIEFFKERKFARLKLSDRGPHLFAFLFLGGIMPFLALSINHKVEANWPLFTFFPMYFLVVRYFSDKSRKKLFSRLMILQVCFFAFLIVVLVWKPNLWMKESNPFFKADGFQEMAIEIENIRKKYGISKDSFFYASSYYQTSSLLSYYTDGHPDYLILIESEGSKNYRFWNPPNHELRGKDCLYVWRDPEEFIKMRVFFKEEMITVPFEFISKDRLKKRYNITYFKSFSLL